MAKGDASMHNRGEVKSPERRGHGEPELGGAPVSRNGGGDVLSGLTMILMVALMIGACSALHNRANGTVDWRTARCRWRCASRKEWRRRQS
jgi:hypothetical protein